MSDAFSISPVPSAAEGFDIKVAPQQERKFSCEEGTYNGIVTKFDKFEKPGKPMRILMEVTLLQDGVKGIRATRYFDTQPTADGRDFTWMLTNAVKAFGIVPVDGVLPLRENLGKIKGAQCRVLVRPREFNSKVYMDIVQVMAPAESEPAPF